MQINIDKKLYDLLCKIVQFNETNGRKESAQPVNSGCITSLIESLMEDYIIDFFNDNESLYNTEDYQNEFYTEIKNGYREYKKNE